MALKLANKTSGKKDEYGFLPSELIPRFAAFTGRKERTPEQIKAIAESFLLNGQEQAFTYRKSFDGYAIPITGHTRILAGQYITDNGLTDNKGIQYGPENPFIVYGTYRQMNELEAVIHTFVENDPDTRTPPNDVDIAFLIRTLGENFGITDALIAEKLGKPASWVSNHRKLLDLDADTQNEIIAGTVKFNGALTAAAIDPKIRKQAIAKAKADGGGKASASGIATAARELTAAAGTAPTKALSRTDAEFKAWVKEAIEANAVGPKQAFLFAIRDFRAGTINAAELTAVFDAISDEVAVEA
jgi:hypothetical protein